MRIGEQYNFDRTLRHCENCKIKKPKELGGYVEFNKGLNQKWYCCDCLNKRVKLV